MPFTQSGCMFCRLIRGEITTAEYVAYLKQTSVPEGIASEPHHSKGSQVAADAPSGVEDRQEPSS